MREIEHNGSYEHIVTTTSQHPRLNSNHKSCKISRHIKCHQWKERTSLQAIIIQTVATGEHSSEVCI